MIVRAALLGTLVVTMAMPADAAEINVIAAGAVRGIIAGMIDDYSKQTGHKFNLTVGPTGRLRDAIASGKPADLVIVSAPLMADMEKNNVHMILKQLLISKIYRNYSLNVVIHREILKILCMVTG